MYGMKCISHRSVFQGVEIFSVGKAVLMAGHDLVKIIELSYFLKIQSCGIPICMISTLCYIHFSFDDRFHSLEFTFSAVKNCMTARWHRLEAFMMQTMPFSKLIRCHTHLTWSEDIACTSSTLWFLSDHAQLSFSANANLLQQCYFHLGGPHIYS